MTEAEVSRMLEDMNMGVVTNGLDGTGMMVGWPATQ